MKTTTLFHRVCGSSLLLAALGASAVFIPAACGVDKDPPAKPKEVKVGKNVVLEIDGDKRRVLVEAKVCLRKGLLEQLLTRKNIKAHEAILSADVDAREIHTALLAARAKAGSTVRYVPKFQPPTGTTIKITLRYEEKGKMIEVPAQKWIRTIKNKKEMNLDWVFAGSRLFQDPCDPKKEPLYLANDGDVICVANFDTALLDVPVDSSKDNEDLAFEAHTERIPPIDTKVMVILEPVLEKEKPKK